MPTSHLPRSAAPRTPITASSNLECSRNEHWQIAILLDLNRLSLSLSPFEKPIKLRIASGKVILQRLQPNLRRLRIIATVLTEDKGSQAWAAEADQWKEMGATHLTVRTMASGLASNDEHIETLRRFKEAYP